MNFEMNGTYFYYKKKKIGRSKQLNSKIIIFFLSVQIYSFYLFPNKVGITITNK